MISLMEKKKQSKIKLTDKMLPSFFEFYNDAKKGKYTIYVHKGGRNTAKSSHISLFIILEMMRNTVNALCIRKVATALHESVYEQLAWAIDYLGVEEYWERKKSPLSLVYTPTETRVIFRGAHTTEDIQKIKSIKTSKHPIALLWIEELSEFKNEEEIDVIENSVIRAELPDGLKYKIFYSYNPPKRKQSWVNKKYNTQFPLKNTKVYHSTYLDNPFVSGAFVEKGEELKEKNPHKYKWIYLGEPIGGGIVPFENLVFRTITDEEIHRMEHIRQGIDFGYAADPVAVTRWHYDKTRRKIYALKEIYGVKISNRELAELMEKNGMADVVSICDSAEPKSIDELNQLGIPCTGAIKGPGSVEFGEKWLDQLEEIVIDYMRTPNIAREFEAIDYQIDKDGNMKNKLEDKDNHCVDSARYSLEADMLLVDDNDYSGSYGF